MSTTDDAGDGDGLAEMALMVRSFQLSKMLQVAAALGLADRVADGPRSVSGLARECNADLDMLLRLCRALAAFGVFAVDDDGQVAHTSRSRWLRQSVTPTLHHAAMFWTSSHQWESWANLEHSVRTGECALESVFGMPAFEYYQANPAQAALFGRFMQYSPEDRHAAVVAAYDFSAPLVVDVGGGTGALLAAILRAHPATSGVLIEEEAVVAEAHDVLERAGVVDRCRLEPLDFLDSVTAGGDVYTLSMILHDWDDAECATILGNCRAAMGPDKRLLVIERLLEQEAGDTIPMNYLADLTMMVIGHGRERTVAEYSKLLTSAGFTQPSVVRTTSPFCILESSSV